MDQRNRVVDGMTEWLQREENISSMFSPATLGTRYFKELKLDYLRDLHRQIRQDASKDERMTLRILKGERKQLERSLYPNRLVRLAQSLYSSIRHSLEKRKGIEISQKTGWMMQIVPKDEKKAIRPTQEKAPRYVKPEMVVKKRTSQDKGLKL